MSTQKFLYLFWMRRPTAHFLDLPPLDREGQLTSEFQVMLDSGGKDIYAFYTRAAAQPWWQFGVYRFPSFAALTEYQMRMEAGNWRSMMETVTYIGTESMEPVSQIPPAKEGEVPVFKAFLVRMTPAFYALTPDLRNDLLGQVQKRMETSQGISLLMCDISWATEPWQFFGIEMYPNVECAQEYSRMLGEMGWFNFVDSESMIGTLT